MRRFQCSSASRKFLNISVPFQYQPYVIVSVLFSEPKIPQYVRFLKRQSVWLLFQCSSASRKFLNQRRQDERYAVAGFQCSSASRKFLNTVSNGCQSSTLVVSVLFSEPKIPQDRETRDFAVEYRVSVLFSEPKIPQYDRESKDYAVEYRFQCSSASRKFLNAGRTYYVYQTTEFQCSSASRKFLNAGSSTISPRVYEFQCSSASRKFLNRSCCLASARAGTVSVLFSEPKIPQSLSCWRGWWCSLSFSALQRAENSSSRPSRALE